MAHAIPNSAVGGKIRAFIDSILRRLQPNCFAKALACETGSNLGSLALRLPEFRRNR
jgi:hypothetical protein